MCQQFSFELEPFLINNFRDTSRGFASLINRNDVLLPLSMTRSVLSPQGADIVMESFHL